MKLSTKLIIGFVVLVAIVFVAPLIFGYIFVNQNKDLIEKMISLSLKEESLKTVDFSEIDQQFNFSAEIPSALQAEYLPSLKAINVYDPNLPGDSSIDKSQLYITYFNAGSFLTLNTVDIIGAEKMTIGARKAILYTITKKTSVPNFTGQPNWRNFTHNALDIRLNSESPTIFYSFAYNPDFGEKPFNIFISSINFQ